MQAMEVTGPNGGPNTQPRHDLSKLSDEEFNTFRQARETLSKLLAKTSV